MLRRTVRLLDTIASLGKLCRVMEGSCKVPSKGGCRVGWKPPEVVESLGEDEESGEEPSEVSVESEDTVAAVGGEVGDVTIPIF